MISTLYNIIFVSEQGHIKGVADQHLKGHGRRQKQQIRMLRQKSTYDHKPPQNIPIVKKRDRLESVVQPIDTEHHQLPPPPHRNRMK